ncbi:Mov34/MPN/PAD-1 family protein [Geopsychrobacter electrodiphilus]|uniref:Mov34/MPN/PAD-1 family protein n=1 Tax=Geopsychrobacter electrodiphilus TaxID=225196 RepID=UPI0003717B4B|nr:Mov34/MPN/PAD-1 family protein [Geopsychrobacter electrodiphilus]
MDRFWFEKAIQYIQEHNAFEEVSEIAPSGGSKIAIVSSVVSIGLPSRFIRAGITDIGVKCKEEVLFLFSDLFPLKAPKIKLRDNFPRCFPHINPSETGVYPCVFEGDPSELLQQSEWMNGLLNQLVDWLEKAASNELLDYSQGWEPMRNDHCSGFMLYDLNEVLDAYLEKETSYLSRAIYYEERKNLIVTGGLCNIQKRLSAHTVFIKTPRVIDCYLPNKITNLAQFYEYARSVGIDDIQEFIERIDLENLNENKLFIVLSIRRPVKIINSKHDIEFLNFVVHKSKARKRKKRVLPDTPVGMLSHLNARSQELLKQLSGTKTKTKESKNIALVGCGSLGSKIGMHLTRNGNGPFLCVDNDIFLPHNSARHALTLTWAQNKADLLSLSMFSASSVEVQANSGTAIGIDYSNSRLIIDTTASLSVRSFFMSRTDIAPVISGGLYGQGLYGILLSENKTKECLLVDLWAHLYRRTLEDESLRGVLFASQIDNVRIGEGCSSQTMIVDDSRISLMAATMSLKIQKSLEDGLPGSGEILISKYNENFSLETSLFSAPESKIIRSVKNLEWDIRLSEEVRTQMKRLMGEKSPVETGGVLLGTVFLFSKTIVITGLLDAPPDSIEKRDLFVLGTEGLERNIKQIERRTNGKVTYLGTWHSHPRGGGASNTDNGTYKKLLFVRNYEPTICLIISPDDVIAL